MKFAFIFSGSPDPLINNRIEMVNGQYDTYFIYLNRTNEVNFEVIHQDINNIEIPVKGNYKDPIRRLLPTVRFALKAIKKIREIKPEVVYAANIDMLFITRLALLGKIKNTTIIYEVADLHRLIVDKPHGFSESMVHNILIFLERRLCRKIGLLVLTSEKFYDVYFHKFVPKGKVLFIPNMPKLSAYSGYKHKSGGKFTVGFIGLVRYKQQMKMLLNVATICNINILFAGAALDDEIQELCENEPYVEYYGKYDYDAEISTLYGKLDCVYSVYDADLNNVKVALPNKLYEAIYCGLPIIVAKGTYLAELVEEMGVGVTVSHTDENELADALNKLSQDKNYYQSIVKNCEIHRCEIKTSYYNDILLNRIMGLR
ncbi:MAG: glycosyltransferase [Candidatus Eremiobacterota bacterium]